MFLFLVAARVPSVGRSPLLRSAVAMLEAVGSTAADALPREGCTAAGLTSHRAADISKVAFMVVSAVFGTVDFMVPMAGMADGAGDGDSVLALAGPIGQDMRIRTDMVLGGGRHTFILAVASPIHILGTGIMILLHQILAQNPIPTPSRIIRDLLPEALLTRTS